MIHRYNLTGKKVLITGASGGLGEQIALQIAAHGAGLILVARNEAKLQQVADRAQQLTDQQVSYYACDLTDPDDLHAMLEDLDSLDIDILINNAGRGYFKEAMDLTPHEVNQMLDLNLRSLITITQHFLETITASPEGMIVNIASQAGKTATPKTTVYSATKFGVIGYSNALRLEMKPYNVHVMTVNPGPIATNFFNIAEPSGQYLASLGGMVLSPERLAQTIVAGMQRRKREVNVPVMMDVAARVNGLVPVIGDYLILNLFNKK